MNRLPSRLFALVAVAVLAPVAACGSDDDDTTSARDAGADSSTGRLSPDSGSGLDATSSTDAGGHPDSGAAPLDASSEDGGPYDAASSPCRPVNGTYTLSGPGAGSEQLCPAATGLVCHFATAAGSCALTSQCTSADGGAGTGFFAIPTGTLDRNDTLTYSTTYAIPVVGSFTAACSLSFTSNQTVATLTCSGSVALEGSVSCSYSGTDAL